MELGPAESQVLGLIQNIDPHDDIEGEHITDAVEWINSGASIYRDQNPDKHLVSYFVLIDPDHDSLLLVDHINARLWLPIGGHVDSGEDPRQTDERSIYRCED